MDMLALIAAGALLAAVFSFALAFLSGAAAATHVRGRLEGALVGGTSVIEGSSSTNPLRTTRAGLPFYQYFVGGGWQVRMARQLRLADSQLQPMDLVAIRVMMAGLGFALPYVFLGGVTGIILGLVSGVAGFQLPHFWLNYRRNGRAKRLQAQLPDALTYIANSLKAGFGLMQSLDMASDQLQHPVATELAQTVHETNIGSSMEEAFIGLSERNEDYDLDIVVTAILVQRSTGGNLAEILDTVAHTMRERVRIRGEIATLTAQQKLTGIVIALLPVGVGGMFFLVSPEYISSLFTDPLGRVMLGIAAVLEAIGVLVISRILDIEV
jgi:tight adherence protein B